MVRVCVVGAGVIGLTTAWYLLEHSPSTEVIIIEKKGDLEPHQTLTSDKAAAFLWQFSGSCELTRTWLASLHARGVDFILPGEGVTIAEDGTRTPFPTYSIDPSLTLEWLRKELVSKGAQFISETLTSRRLHELTQSYDFVVHCAGLGARELASDPSLHATQGVLLHYSTAAILAHLGLENGDSFPRVYWDHTIGDKPTCFIRHKNHWSLGGTAIPTPPGSETYSASPEIIKDIKQRVSQCFPGLEKLASLPAPERITVGYRPVRSTPRIEKDEKFSNLIHNYGHGGTGWSLSIDSAAAVLELIKPHL